MSISSGIKLTAPPAIITINTQPSNASPFESSTATYSVNASISRGASLSYQWQKQESTGGGWSNVSNATANSYTTGTLVYANDFGDLYRCVINGSLQAATVTSNTANTTMQRSVITAGYASTTSQNIIDGDSIVIFVTGQSVSNGFSLSYQWQRQDSGGGSWTDISGETSQNLTLNPVSYANDNGDKFRCYLTATGAALPVASLEYTLNVSPADGVMTVAQSVDSSVGYYGASDASSSTFAELPFNPFGSISDSNFAYAFERTPSNDDSYTYIELKPGTYDGYTVSANGAIDGDQPSFWRYFKIGGGGQIFNFVGPYYQQPAGGYYLNLSNQVGEQVFLQYNTQDNTDTYADDTMWPATYSSFYHTGKLGVNADTNEVVFGQLRSNYISQVYYVTNDKTYIKLKDGTYSLNTSSVTVSSGAIGSDTNGSTQKFTIGGTDYTFTFGSSDGRYYASSDALSLAANLQSGGSPLTVVYDPGRQSSGGGGATGGTYEAGTDYSDGQSGPPGIAFTGPGGPYANNGVMVITNNWTDSQGATDLLALSSGDTFTVSAVPVGGGSPITSTITLTSDWVNIYGYQWRADMSSSPEVSVNYPNYVPLSVTIGGGGGGAGGGTITVSFGYWGGPSGTGIALVVDPATNPESITALDALGADATITVTDPVDGDAVVTIIGSLIKNGPFGPGFYQYNGTTSTVNPDGYNTFQNLNSVTI